MKSSLRQRSFSLIGITLVAAALASCDGSGENGQGNFQGTDQVTGTPVTIPTTDHSTDASTSTGSGKAPEIGPTCHADGTICLALKYVVYKDSSGTPSVSESQAISNLEKINAVWKQCGIQFQVDDFRQVNPTEYGLKFGTATSAELDTIRETFVDDSTLLVASTGTWTGTLGSGAANAWTAMPGGGPYGVVLEYPVATYPNIIAHELGHYLNLDHYGSTTDLMNPVIYDSSTTLTTSQCSTARTAAKAFWSRMIR